MFVLTQTLPEDLAAAMSEADATCFGGAVVALLLAILSLEAILPLSVVGFADILPLSVVAVEDILPASAVVSVVFFLDDRVDLVAVVSAAILPASVAVVSVVFFLWDLVLLVFVVSVVSSVAVRAKALPAKAASIRPNVAIVSFLISILFSPNLNWTPARHR